jgi:hypothetical protein
MVLNTTFNNISVISWSHFNLWNKPEKATDLSQVIDHLYHIMMDTRSGIMIKNVH